jgi:arginyl-tRNA synthetase
MELTIPEVSKITKHIGHGVLRLPTGKMSSRTGNVITAEALINDVKEAVAEKIQGREDLEDIEKEEIKEQVALSAIRYSILKQSIGKDIVFDLDKSISFQGDSGPYIQYTYARLKSILRKEELGKFDPQNISMETDRPLILKLAQFPEVIGRSAENYSPSNLVTYLFDLAQMVNNYYENNPILKSEPEIKAVRMGLVNAVAETLKNGLNLLGIKTLERM